MCGIAGVRRFGTDPINAAELKTLLCSLEYRGNHATGVALMTPDGIKIHKEPVPAWSFIALPETEAFFDEYLEAASMALLHTRFATQGSPEDNRNNHPFFVDNTAIVHNGSINNHTFLFNDMKLKRSCETDSDIIRAVLDEKGLNAEGLTSLTRMTGSAAIAAFSMDDPDKLLLARSGSPLVYGTSEDKLWWASDMQAIQRAVRPWVRQHGLMARKPRTDVGYFTVPDHTAYILSAEGLDLRREFKTCVSYRAPVYTVNTNYADKKRGFKEETARKRRQAIAATVSVTQPQVFTKRGALCPNPKCRSMCLIPRDKRFADYTCHTCKESLAPIDSYPPHQIHLEK